MTKMWAVTATVSEGVTDRDGQYYRRTRQVPTFYLHPSVQGTLTAESAEVVALSVIRGTLHFDPTILTDISVEEVEL